MFCYVKLLFYFKGSKLADSAEMDSISSVQIDPYAKYLCRTACWDWSTVKFGLALRTPSSTSLTLRACRATNSWRNTDMKWLDSQLNLGVDIPGREFNFYVFLWPKCATQQDPLFSSQQTFSCSCDGTVLQWDSVSLKVRQQHFVSCDRLSSIQVHDSALWCCRCFYLFPKSIT